MVSNYFRISSRTVWALVIFNLLLTVYGFLGKYYGWEAAESILIAGLIMFFSAWIIVFHELIKNRVSMKIVWVLSMLVLPVVTPAVYLLRRKNVLRPQYL